MLIFRPPQHSPTLGGPDLAGPRASLRMYFKIKKSMTAKEVTCLFIILHMLTSTEFVRKIKYSRIIFSNSTHIHN